MMHFDESMRILSEQEIGLLRTERLPLVEARGRVLAERIVADRNSPEVPTSGMDGYAVRYGDLALGRLRIVGINPAGNDALETLRPGEAIKTFTGSMMPPGSDTLIPIENVTVEGEEIVIDEPVPPGFSVRPVGENYAEGELLMAPGTPLEFPQIGVLAGLNRPYVTVYSRPRVAILATGSELLELGESRSHAGQLRSSNNYTIEAIARRYGGEPIQLGCVGDDPAAISAAVQNALAQADIVVSTGGVSVGDFDFVKDVVTSSSSHCRASPTPPPSRRSSTWCPSSPGSSSAPTPSTGSGPCCGSRSSSGRRKRSSPPATSAWRMAATSSISRAKKSAPVPSSPTCWEKEGSSTPPKRNPPRRRAKRWRS